MILENAQNALAAVLHLDGPVIVECLRDKRLVNPQTDPLLKDPE
jgi:hypothetical protein